MEYNGTLKDDEYHPSADSAFKYVKKYISDIGKMCILKESLASCALSGDRLSEICLETLNRIISGKPISDRYLLGLAWFIKVLEDSNKEVIL